METARDDPQSPDEDPRGEDVAEGGYPEAQEPGADPTPGSRTRDGDDDAPGTSSSEDSDPSSATGNPGAAGG
ncbi:MAG: hypothetical protein QOG77_191 [Solirubrobacteraceae bacterium]|jgi:hypothetical protein|nr:hypothetical protein [Solirubrobacteraceae bacterium]